ncbi:MAG: hypothetical protein Tsb005_16700 [Gammaproteobacteria bacterium]
MLSNLKNIALCYEKAMLSKFLLVFVLLSCSTTLITVISIAIFLNYQASLGLAMLATIVLWFLIIMPIVFYYYFNILKSKTILQSMDASMILQTTKIITLVLLAVSFLQKNKKSTSIKLTKPTLLVNALKLF